MSRFLVKIYEEATYEKVVEAETKEEACALVEEQFLGDGGISVGAGFATTVSERDIWAERTKEKA